MATSQEIQQIDQLLQVIRESALEIIDNEQVSNSDLVAYIFDRGITFAQNNRSLQTIVDIGAIGLAYAVRTHSHGKDNGSSR